ncbi:hypothetical protein [Amycolatopsis sp. GM8]|uniref:hypothetical protein n=1 Tax=Amycolatopsis sp. GM8 TaxID=2896530 RepID=UPI001F236437|nr:hypothetical protein [Amycolatopsis sp. GM8]
MTLERPCGEHIVWRRVTGFAELRRLRDAVCDLLFDCAADTVASLLRFLDDVCAPGFPVEVCLVRGSDPHYFRVDVDGADLAAPGRPGFMDGNEAGWGVLHREDGMSVWAYVTIPVPGRAVAPWSRLGVSLPPNPMLN